MLFNLNRANTYAYAPENHLDATSFNPGAYGGYVMSACLDTMSMYASVKRKYENK